MFEKYIKQPVQNFISQQFDKTMQPTVEKYTKLVESFKEHQLSKLIEQLNIKLHSTLNSPHFNPRIAPYLKNVNETGEPYTNFELDPDNISQIKKVINGLYHARLAFIDLENLDLRNPSRYYADIQKVYNHTIPHAYKASYLLTHLDVDLRGIFNEELSIILPLLKKFQDFSDSHAKEKQQISQAITDAFKTYPLSHNIGLVTGTAVNQLQPSGGDLDYNFLADFGAVLPTYIEKLTSYIKQYSSQIIENEPNLNREKLEELKKAALDLLNNLEDLKRSNFFLPLKVINYIHIINHVITLSTSSIDQLGDFSESTQDVIRDNLAQLKYTVLPTLFGLVDKIEDNAMLKPGTLSEPLMKQIKPLYQILIHYSSKPVDFEAKGEELLSIEDSRFLALRLELTYKRIDEANKSLFKIKKAEEAFTNFYEVLEKLSQHNITSNHLPQETKDELVRYYKVISPYMAQIDIDLNQALIDHLQGPASWSSVFWNVLSMKKPADYINHILAQKEALQKLILKDRATQNFHIALNEDLIQSVQRQTDLVLFPYAEQTNLFIIDESKAFPPPIETKPVKNDQDNPPVAVIAEVSKAVEPPIKTAPSLQFKQEGSHNLVKNPDNLSSAEALTLSQWYRNKHNKFIQAKNAYTQFFQLTKGNVLNLHLLSPELRAQCRNLYNLFQPYFINGLPEKYKKDGLAYDKYIAHVFAGKTSDTPPPLNDPFTALNEHFQQYFTTIDRSWYQKSRAYQKRAEEKYDEEIEASELKQDPSLNSRRHYLIKHTNYSKAINEFRTSLNQMTSVFNQAMQNELKIPPPGRLNTALESIGQTSPIQHINALNQAYNILSSASSLGLPYPEIEDNNQTLAQSRQVLAIKRLYNGLYHIEGVVHQLEQLNDRSLESVYVGHLGLIYKHVNELIHIGQNLASDPHLRLLTRDLLNKAQLIIATIQEHTEAYQVKAETVLNEEHVQYNPLWYVVNAFNIIPKHIRVLANHNYITSAELTQLNENAKESTLKIEAIINSSDSYFKLFLQTPNMYFLYRNLMKKFHEFTSTTHDAVVNNLDQIKSTVFTPMLVEADLWEDKLGLRSGTLSGPLKKVIDEYFKGFVKPLGLKSQAQIALVCDNKPLLTRQEVTKAALDNAQNHLDKTQTKYAPIEKLYKLLHDYERLKNRTTPTTNLALENAKQGVQEAFKLALPKLVRLQSKLTIEPNYNATELGLDELFNSGTKSYDRKLSNIRSLIVASHHYYLGLQATYQMKLNTAQEKLAYLDALSHAQKEADTLFVHEFTQDVYAKQLDALCNRHIGLSITGQEYNTALKSYLKTFEKGIIERAKTQDDIHASVKKLLSRQIQVFERIHFANYYHLDMVRGALNQFTHYLNNARIDMVNGNSIFENEETLDAKNKLIHSLVEIAENEQLAIQDRIAQIKAKIQNPSSKTLLFAHKQADYFSFSYLAQCFLSLLEALYLYTPQRKKIYNKICDAANSQPEISALSKRFGLFASNPNQPSEAAAEELDNSATLAVASA